MRKVCYSVAMSLDGYIEGPNGSLDWIVTDPAIDFKALFARFDTALIGRRTFEMMANAGRASMPEMKMFIFSRTLKPGDVPKGATIVSQDQKATVESLRSAPGKDIWLFGGGKLFASLMADGLVDTVEVTIIPALIGGGLPLAPGLASFAKLRLESHKVYPSGLVALAYAVAR
jgi:dihydrofolate reductase